MRNSFYIILASLCWISFYSSLARGEAMYLPSQRVVMVGCRSTNTDYGFLAVNVEQCQNKLFCMNGFIECYFVRKDVLDQANGDWKKVVARGPSLDWIKAGASIFCSQKNGSCEREINECANESPDQMHCSLTKVPGYEKAVMTPKGTQ